MKTKVYHSIIGDDSMLRNIAPKVLEANETTSRSLEDVKNKMVSFRVEQRITNFESSNDVNIGGFINANSKVERFQTRYIATLLSDQKEDIYNPDGVQIATKVDGIGLELIVRVNDIKTKVNGNYGILAASAKLDFAKVDYKLDVKGLTKPSLISKLPSIKEGDFSANAFTELAKFIDKAKSDLKNNDNTKLYPIELIAEEEVILEKSDIKSIYFGVKMIEHRAPLIDAIQERRDKDLLLNEKIVLYVYRYFEITNAYAKPSESQGRNAAKWLDLQYNKVSRVGLSGSWVDIDSAFTGDIGDDNVNYKPHPKPVDWATAAKALGDELQNRDANFSSELGLAAITKVDAGFDSIMITRNIAWYMDTNDDPVENSRVIETRYGVGVRLMVKLTNIEFGTDVSFSKIGAISELNLANVEYSISGIGFADSALLDFLPGPQNITESTINNLLTSLDQIKNYLSNVDVKEFNPQPYQIRVMETEKVDPTLEAQAYTFSARQVTRKVSLEDTLPIARKAGINEQLIRDAYQDLGVEGNERINSRHRQEARDWLKV